MAQGIFAAMITGLTAMEEYDLTHSTLRSRYEASIEALRRDVLSDKLAVARLRNRLGTLLTGTSHNGDASPSQNGHHKMAWGSAIRAFRTFENATKATADAFGHPISLQRSPTMEGIELDREVRVVRMKAVARERFLDELKRLEPIPNVVHVTWPRHIDVANMSGQPILREVCANTLPLLIPQLSPLCRSPLPRHSPSRRASSACSRSTPAGASRYAEPNGKPAYPDVDRPQPTSCAPLTLP